MVAFFDRRVTVTQPRHRRPSLGLERDLRLLLAFSRTSTQRVAAGGAAAAAGAHVGDLANL